MSVMSCLPGDWVTEWLYCLTVKYFELLAPPTLSGSTVFLHHDPARNQLTIIKVVMKNRQPQTFNHNNRCKLTTDCYHLLFSKFFLTKWHLPDGSHHVICLLDHFILQPQIHTEVCSCDVYQNGTSSKLDMSESWKP